LLRAYAQLDEDMNLAIGISDKVSEATRLAAERDSRGDLYVALRLYGEASAALAECAPGGDDSLSQDKLKESVSMSSMDESTTSIGAEQDEEHHLPIKA